MAGFQLAQPGSSPWAGLGRMAAECLAGLQALVVCLGLSPLTPSLGTLLSVDPAPELLALNLLHKNDPGRSVPDEGVG